MPTTTATQFDAAKLKNSYCVIRSDDPKKGANTGDVALWNSDFQMFADLGQLQFVSGKPTAARSLAWAKQGELWVVAEVADDSANIYQWKKPDPAAPATDSNATHSNGWTALKQLGNVQSVAFDAKGTPYAVDTAGQVQVWGTYSWVPAVYNTHDWHVNMIAFQGDTVWCVRNEHDQTEVGMWNADYHRWASLGEISATDHDKTIVAIAFDQSATPSLWGVAKDGSVGYWESQDSDKKYVEHWIEPDPAKLVLPNIQWLAWQPAS